MNMPIPTPTAETSFALELSTQDAIEAACASVAPTWPLDRMIAVNPYWENISQNFRDFAHSFGKVAGSPMVMPISYYADLWKSGKILSAHLLQALEERKNTCSIVDAEISLTQLIDLLDEPNIHLTPAPLLSDALDSRRDLIHKPAWCDTITHQIGQFCAAYFDHGQADWHPDQSHDLYASWRKTLISDHSVSLLMRSPKISMKAKQLAEDPLQQIHLAVKQLSIPKAHTAVYLQVVLMRVSGWAAWCSYRQWQAKLDNRSDQALVDLLAIRLSWECLIDDLSREDDSLWQAWQQTWSAHFGEEKNQPLDGLLIWQRAHEISYQSQLFTELTVAKGTVKPTPRFQAAFCIDVRSEVFRRHLEAQSDEIQTIGFAGFFGLPISYTPLGTDTTRPQLPGLLAPQFNITDTSGNEFTDQAIVLKRKANLAKLQSWHTFQLMPASAFTLVEALGIGYIHKLIKKSLPLTATVNNLVDVGLNQSDHEKICPSLKSQFGEDSQAMAKIARQVLTAMNLTDRFAPLILLVGHGSQTENNPQRAGLDCGACCGQTGEVNARALADLLNDHGVRKILKQSGMPIPDTTQFVAGLHNTTTDEIKLFDTNQLQPTYSEELAEINNYLSAAGLATRQERAPALGLEKWISTPQKLTKKLKQRANDWAQTRPEWGLANNGALIVAVREKTRQMNLDGRTFLHDYDYQSDPQGELLELIMTAPMIVTHWINMQYFASTVDNKRFGSGNKTLHNVVGGKIGIFEGNGGDLRIGLAWQSVHDGEQWRHEPIRLTVVIDAPKTMIEQVVDKHAMVKNLIDNQWLYVAQLQENKIEIYRHGVWQIWDQPKVVSA